MTTSVQATQHFQELLARGDVAGAEHMARRALRDDPDRVDALHVLGVIAQNRCSPDEAIEHLKRARELAPEHALVATHLAAALGAAGRDDEALVHARAAVAMDPHLGDAHYNLGVLFRQREQFTEAADAFHQAIDVDPRNPPAHYNLANALRDLDHRQEAIEHYHRAIELRPKYVKALLNLGIMQLQMGDVDGAIDSFERAVNAEPGVGRSHYRLGTAHAAAGDAEKAAECFRQAITLESGQAEWQLAYAQSSQQQGELDKAIAGYRQAVDLDPENLGATVALAGLLHAVGHYGEAVEVYRRSAAIDPDSLEILNSLGVSLLELKDYDAAAECFRQVLQQKSGDLTALNNWGALHMACSQFQQAADKFRETVEAEPRHATAQANLATAYQELGRYEEAHTAYDAALKINATLADARWNRALLLLREGSWQEGWSEYKWRWRRPAFVRYQYRCPPGANASDALGSRNVLDVPLWEGEPLEGKSILLFAEQGLGDVIQFVRFAPLLKQRGAGCVVLECQKTLVPLLSSAEGVDQIVARGDALPPLDVQLPLMSAPFRLAVSVDDVPWTGPYLSADAQLAERWRDVLAEIPGLRIGISWQGNPKYPHDRVRSIPLACYAPLADRPSTQLISLQHGLGTEQIEQVADRFSVRVLGDEIDRHAGPFMDTAAILTGLDLVVTSDTSVAHLAGALGVPVWLALPVSCDWRWMFQREDCPWYPTMRLFRQRERDDWDDVFARIATDLAGIARRDNV